MSRSARIEILAITALAGCMKIYPDPELPDIEAQWHEGDCAGGGETVLLTLAGVDDASVQQQVTAPCAALDATYKDVARQRYRLDATLLDADGEQFSRAQTLDIDLRDGLDETAYLFFGGFNNVRVAWQFEGGGTCASVGVQFVDVRFRQGDIVASAAGAACSSMALFASAPRGIYAVDVVGSDERGVVATAPPIEPVEVSLDMVTDLGVVTLVPCGASCP